MRVVGVMGSGTSAHEDLARPLGAYLARLGVHLLCGGGGGVMASVAKHFRAAGTQGLVVGIVPAARHASSSQRPLPPSGSPNPHVDLVIQTHLPARGADGTDLSSRNHINILSSHVVVALPGGGGTLSEIALARRYRTPIAVYRGSHPPLAGPAEPLLQATELYEIERFVEHHLDGPPTIP